MRSIYILSSLFCLLSLPLSAQRSVSKGFTCVVLQEQRTIMGIGLKAGDPISLTMKGYFLKRFGIEATAGYAMSGNFSPYVTSTLEKEPAFSGFTYQNHEVNGAYAAQARVMMHFPIMANLPGLDWFVLAGYHYRYLDINYQYIYLTIPGNPTSREPGSTDYTMIDQGPELGVGFEYVVSDKPFAFFAEVSALRKDNGINNKITALGGVGIRFNIALKQRAGKPTGSQRNLTQQSRKKPFIHTLSDITTSKNGKRSLMTKAPKKTKKKVTVHKHKNQDIPGMDPDNF